jgi:hypothetical protein
MKAAAQLGGSSVLCANDADQRVEIDQDDIAITCGLRLQRRIRASLRL